MPDTAVPQPVDPPSSTQNPRKLRESCTDCAISKVKCSKEKPACSRCARRGVTCTYMVSRRTGRTSSKNAARVGGSISAGLGRSGTPASTGNNNDPGGPTLRVGTPLLAPSSSGAGPSPAHQRQPSPDIWSSILSPSALAGDTAGLSPPLTSIGTDVGDLFDILHSPMLIDHSPEQPTQANQNAPPSSDPFGELSVSDQDTFSSHTSGSDSVLSKSPTCCFTVALDILTRLFPNAPADCKLPGSQPGGCNVRTIESVISENKQIIESLNNLLDCQCSQDEYIISIITLIVFKVMGWYAAAADDATPMHDGIGWGGFASPPDRTNPGSLGEQVLRLPSTMVGNSCVAGQYQDRMAAQLVLGELHRVQRLVNALSKRLESIRLRTGRAISGSSSGSSSIGDAGDASIIGARASPLSVPTFCQLEEDLRKRLRALSSETIDVLRRT